MVMVEGLLDQDGNPGIWELNPSAPSRYHDVRAQGLSLVVPDLVTTLRYSQIQYITVYSTRLSWICKSFHHHCCQKSSTTRTRGAQYTAIEANRPSHTQAFSSSSLPQHVRQASHHPRSLAIFFIIQEDNHSSRPRPQMGHNTRHPLPPPHRYTRVYASRGLILARRTGQASEIAS